MHYLDRFRKVLVLRPRSMRLAILVAALALLAPVASAQQSQTARQGSDQYREPGFMAVAFLISDSTFFERWQRPEPPEIHDDTRYVRGQTAYPILIFQTDAVDEEGHASLTYDLSVTKPDGSPYGSSPYRDILAWESAPTPGMVLALGQTSLVIEDDDLLGLYKVDLVLHDRIRGQSFPLSLAFEVSE